MKKSSKSKKPVKNHFLAVVGIIFVVAIAASLTVGSITGELTKIDSRKDTISSSGSLTISTKTGEISMEKDAPPTRRGQPKGKALTTKFIINEDGSLKISPFGTGATGFSGVHVSGALGSGSLVGPDKAYACVNALGNLYRSSDPCIDGGTTSTGGSSSGSPFTTDAAGNLIISSQSGITKVAGHFRAADLVGSGKESDPTDAFVCTDALGQVHRKSTWCSVSQPALELRPTISRGSVLLEGSDDGNLRINPSGGSTYLFSKLFLDGPGIHDRVEFVADAFGNLNITPDSGFTNIKGDLSATSLVGPDNAYACVDSNGKLFRSLSPCR